MSRNNRQRSAVDFGPIAFSASSLTMASPSPVADAEFADFLAAAGLDMVGPSSPSPTKVPRAHGPVAPPGPRLAGTASTAEAWLAPCAGRAEPGGNRYLWCRLCWGAPLSRGDADHDDYEDLE